MKRNILFSILVVLFNCVYVTAETIQWECGKNLTCSISEDYVLVISGTGVIEQGCSSCPNGNGFNCWASVVIKDGITGIGESAFEDKILESITIPNSVTSIGATAFGACSYLKSIIIPKSVTHIGEAPFLGCDRLESIKVNAGNPIYDSRNNCNAIIETATNKLIAGTAHTIIPSSVTSIGMYAFIDCRHLTSIVIPNSVTTIEDGAFGECRALESIMIPDSVIYIAERAFLGCQSLSISLPARFKEKVDLSSCASVTYY